MNRKSIVTLVTMVILSISSFAETSTNTLKVPLTIENKKTALPNDFTSQLPAVTTFDNVNKNIVTKQSAYYLNSSLNP